MAGKQKIYETLSEAVNDLLKRGYSLDLNIHENGECLVCHQKELSLSPDDFEIDEIHRFEGQTDPADETILFAISSDKYDLKGTLVDAFGTYSDTEAAEIVRHLYKHS